MKFKRTQDSFRTILKIVIGVVFAVAILAISYKAATTSQENRSKAAVAQITYKSWEFSGTTAEGWLSTNLTGTRVAGGLLTAKKSGSTASPATLVNKSVNSVLPIGNKYIKLRLAVANAPGNSAVTVLGVTKIPTSTSCTPNRSACTITICPTPPPCPPGAMCKQIMPPCTVQKGICSNYRCVPYATPPPATPTPAATTPFTISVSYVSKGTNRTLPQIRGIADGKLYEYSVLMTDIGGVSVSSVQIGLSSVKTGTSVQMDYVRFVGSPPPTPTPANCTSNGSTCAITICPTMPPCPAGAMCAQVMPVCTVQKGICSNYRCVPYTTPSPTPTCYKTCSANGVCTIVCSQPVTPKPTIKPTSTSIPTPIAQAACNYSCSTNLNCLSGLICYSGVCRNPSCIGQTNCSCPPGPTATPLITPNPSICVLNGGKCESLYTNCPTPDNQLPYDCGMGYRCIPKNMICGPTATPLVTPNPSICVLNGGKCESLYTNCPTPDNQLPYDCGMGYRCIPSTMVCH